MSTQPSRSPRSHRIVSDLSGRAPTAQRMMFGNTLRQRRLASGLSESEVARRTRYSASKINRLEHGLHDFKRTDVQRLLDIYGVTVPQERERLLELASKANERGWWDPWRDVTTKALQTYVSLESLAQRIRSYESGQLHGLLQIPDYTAALVRANSRSKEKREIDRIVELREMRQKRFMEDSRMVLRCVLDEVTLTRGYGDRQVMRRQIEHLLDLADHRRISFRLAEMSAPNLPVQIGPMTVFDFEDGQLPEIVYIERVNGGLYLQEPQDVDELIKGFDQLMQASLHHRACVRRLMDHRKKYAT